MNYETIFKNAVKKIMRRMIDAEPTEYIDITGEGNPTKLVEDVVDALGIIELEPEHAIWGWAVEVLEEFENND